MFPVKEQREPKDVGEQRQTSVYSIVSIHSLVRKPKKGEEDRKMLQVSDFGQMAD